MSSIFQRLVTLWLEQRIYQVHHRADGPDVNRQLTEVEKWLLLRFSDAPVGDTVALKTQLRSAVVKSESAGFLNLVIAGDAPRIIDQTGYPIDGWYDDADGALVTLILHIDAAAQIVSCLERFRPDGDPIIENAPSPEAVRVQANVLDDPGQAATFDPEHGWKRYC